MNKFVFSFISLAMVSAMSHARVPEGVSHVHGIFMNNSGDTVLLGAHDGVYALDASGSSTKISNNDHDYMGFVGSAKSDATIFASGHPITGGNFGLIRSDDGGVSWTDVSDGIDGPVDFHLMAIDQSNDRRIYGDSGGLQRTSDGGQTWKKQGKLPENSYNFAVSTISDTRLYVATDSGLMVSENNGLNWQPLLDSSMPSTMVQVTSTGMIHAYVAGQGLIVADEKTLQWKTLSNEFGMRVPVNMVVSGLDENIMIIRDHVGSIWKSVNGGSNWEYFIKEKEMSQTEQSGKTIYQANCIGCHNKDGVGESYSFISITDKNYISAPSMDKNGHAWHHADDQLADIINNGSSRPSRMPAWKDKLDNDEVYQAIAYIKSLWTQRELDCQGPKHMSCM